MATNKESTEKKQTKAKDVDTKKTTKTASKPKSDAKATKATTKEPKTQVKEKATAKATKTTKTATADKKESSKKTETVNANKKEANKEVSENLFAKATVKYERISSRKVKIVADLIRGKNVDEAMAILTYTNKIGTEVLIKLLKSAIANAENNNHMNHSKLYVAEIYSNQGPTLKRIRPAAKGSAVRIRKRTSHTTIVLKERD